MHASAGVSSQGSGFKARAAGKGAERAGDPLSHLCKHYQQLRMSKVAPVWVLHR